MSDVEYSIVDAEKNIKTNKEEMLVIDTAPKPVEDTAEEQLRRAEVAAANMQYLRRLVELAKRQEIRAAVKQKRKEKNRAKNKVARQSRKRNR